MLHVNQSVLRYRVGWHWMFHCCCCCCCPTCVCLFQRKKQKDILNRWNLKSVCRYSRLRSQWTSVVLICANKCDFTTFVCLVSLVIVKIFPNKYVLTILLVGFGMQSIRLKKKKLYTRNQIERLQWFLCVLFSLSFVSQQIICIIKFKFVLGAVQPRAPNFQYFER